jgi:hypothetical protein
MQNCNPSLLEGIRAHDESSQSSDTVGSAWLGGVWEVEEKVEREVRMCSPRLGVGGFGRKLEVGGQQWSSGRRAPPAAEQGRRMAAGARPSVTKLVALSSCSDRRRSLRIERPRRRPREAQGRRRSGRRRRSRGKASVALRQQRRRRGTLLPHGPALGGGRWALDSSTRRKDLPPLTSPAVRLRGDPEARLRGGRGGRGVGEGEVEGMDANVISFYLLETVSYEGDCKHCSR